ncbi:hypothetical protein Ddye_019079 [Dipteronia dyeriana]|uniref:Enoyl reductase (ER) domain-containing protein n=1 Tax=Dipteronia dyeriana TaxID=168575 RepID=A0AAD9TX41_9ROSI|nr:hypothetical protein Ddye_019079 [Dipteronia dyeriana]
MHISGKFIWTVGSEDVSLKLTHCGVCCSDVGGNVERFKAGDHVAVGSYVNSCRDCEECNEGLEVYCSKKLVPTFNSIDEDGTVTKGGFSSFILVHQRYCFKIPDNYPLAFAAPLLCAGISVYTPMMHHKMNQPGKHLGVVGLGGLGHMAVLFGKAFGLHVTVFSTSASKKEEALNLLGADNFVLSNDEHQMKSLTRSLDFIVDSASGDHSFDQYLALLKTKGILPWLAIQMKSKSLLIPFYLVRMRSIGGSWTGGTRHTQEMLNFCGVHKIYPQIEIISIQYTYEAFERMMNNDVKYRFVIDIENSLNIDNSTSLKSLVTMRPVGLDGDAKIGSNVTPLDPSSVDSEVWYGKQSGKYLSKRRGNSTVYSQLYPFECLFNYTLGIIHHVRIDGINIINQHFQRSKNSAIIKGLDGWSEIGYQSIDGKSEADRKYIFVI